MAGHTFSGGAFRFVHFLPLFFVVTAVFCHANQAESGLAACRAEKLRRIAELKENLASVRASLRDVTSQIKNLEEVSHTWDSQITSLVQESDSQIDVLSARTRRQLDEPVQCENERDRLRLVNGTANSDGRVEVFVKDRWSTVAQTWFRSKEAGIVCSVLGFEGSSLPTSDYFFGEGDEYLLVDESCRGSAGVICGNTSSYPVRLADGSGLNEGRVEIAMYGQWGTVCNSNWDTRDAQTVCRSLGYSSDKATAVGGGLFGEGSGPVWLNAVQCAGTEQHVFDCSTTVPLGATGCQHNRDVGVICESGWMKYPVRLVNGSGPGSGRVEIHAFGQWGTVSSSGWDNNDARVVCRLLGYADSPAVAAPGAFGVGTGPVWLNNMQCDGTEEHLLECYSSNPLGGAAWGHSSDAGVICDDSHRCKSSDWYPDL